MTTVTVLHCTARCDTVLGLVEASRGATTHTGAVGPVAAFGLDALRSAAENAGLTQV